MGKTCTWCKEWRQSNEFHANVAAPDGLRSECRSCTNGRARALAFAPDPHLIEKVCPHCGELRPVAEFYPNKRRKDGYASWCKICMKAERDARIFMPDATLCEKVCSDCGQIRPIDEFSKNPQSPDGYRATCRMCRINQRYTLSAHWFNDTLIRQGGGCAICGYSDELVVDHDHACCPGVGACGLCVRGLLCQKCNKGLGAFRDDPTFLARAIEYLSLHKPWGVT